MLTFFVQYCISQLMELQTLRLAHVPQKLALILTLAVLSAAAHAEPIKQVDCRGVVMTTEKLGDSPEAMYLEIATVLEADESITVKHFLINREPFGPDLKIQAQAGTMLIDFVMTAEEQDTEARFRLNIINDSLEELKKHRGSLASIQMISAKNMKSGEHLGLNISGNLFCEETATK